jgi:hypothetical protein
LGIAPSGVKKAREKEKGGGQREVDGSDKPSFLSYYSCGDRNAVWKMTTPFIPALEKILKMIFY